MKNRDLTKGIARRQASEKLALLDRAEPESLFFYDDDGTAYVVRNVKGTLRLHGLGARKDTLEGVKGQLVKVDDCLLFRTEDWHHLKGEAFLKKERRRLEDKLRKDAGYLCRVLSTPHLPH